MQHVGLSNVCHLQVADVGGCIGLQGAAPLLRMLEAAPCAFVFGNERFGRVIKAHLPRHGLPGRFALGLPSLQRVNTAQA